MIAENVLGIKSPCAILLVLEDPVQDGIEKDGSSCVFVLAFRLSASVVHRTADRDRIILYI